jgi:hypothetical protein
VECLGLCLDHKWARRQEADQVYSLGETTKPKNTIITWNIPSFQHLERSGLQERIHRPLWPDIIRHLVQETRSSSF